MRLQPFSIHRPASVAEASGLLTELGDDAAAYCGGTELLLAMKLGLADYTSLIDLKPIAVLREIAVVASALSIGAGATHRTVEASPEVKAWYPELAALLSHVANLRVRAAGTIGGNLCFADPHSDPATFLIAIDALAVCQRGVEVRRVPVREFFTGPYQTERDPGELLGGGALHVRPPGPGLAEQGLCVLARPVVTAAARIELSGDTVSSARLVIGALGPVPIDANEAAASLIGAGPADFAGRARRCAEEAAATCSPMDDGESSPDYLRHLAKVHAERALTQAFTGIGGPR